MRRRAIAVVACLAATLALLVPSVLVLEGGAALVRWSEPGTSLSARAWAHLAPRLGLPIGPGAPRRKSLPLTERDYIVDEDMIRPLFPAFRESVVMFGNSPYEELITPEAARTFADPEYGKMMKPGVTFECGFLKSCILDPLDPITFTKVLQPGRVTDPAVDAFLKRYGFARTEVTIGADGWRRTVPLVERPDVIAVVGDSVAFGVGVADDETLASRLQQRQTDYQFVNLAVPGTTHDSYLRRLERFLAQRPGALRGIVYVHCDNDYRGDVEPPDIVHAIGDFADRHALSHRAFVYQVHVTRSMPDIFRVAKTEKFFARRHESRRLATERGFLFVDFYDIVQDYRARSGSLFASAALYVDHAHFSRLGIEEVVSRVPRFGE